MAAADQIVARLAQQLRARRAALGLGQQELADLSGTSVRFIRNLEHGKTTVRVDKLLAILEVLGLDLQVDVRKTG